MTELAKTDDLVVKRGGLKGVVMTRDCPIVPILHRVVIELPEVQTETASGIVTMTGKEKAREELGSTKGKVIGIGPGCYEHLEKMGSIDINDTVCFKRYSGVDATIGDKKYKIINDEEIFGLLLKSEEGDMIDNMSELASGF